MKTTELDTAVILAGGKSLRYGRNKALIQTEAGILIESIISQLRKVFSRILIIANDLESYSYLNLPVFPDILEGIGPLGGIHSGLMAAGRPAVFFTACDMPRVCLPVVNHMKEQFCKNSPEALLAGRTGSLEPFHAFYSSTLTGPIESYTVQNPSPGIRSFLKRRSCQIVEDSVLDKLCPDRSLFLNINTAEDLLEMRGEAG